MLCEKRLATQLALQLPEQPAAARRVLDLTRQLFDEFFMDQPKPGTIVPFKPKPQAPVAKRRHWLRRRWGASIGSVALGMLIVVTAETDRGYTDSRIEMLSFTLDKAVLLPGEPLRGAIGAKRLLDCPGKIHRVVFHGEDQVMDLESPAEPRPVGEYTHHFSVPLPRLPAGHYSYETWGEFTCLDHLVARTTSPRLPFLVLAADGL